VISNLQGATNLTGRLGTVARTVRHLKLSQVVWRGLHVARQQAYRRIPSLGAWQVRADPNARAAALPAFSLPGPDQRPADLWLQGLVEYQGIQTARNDWRGDGRSKLWRYERQYHAELPSLALISIEDAWALVDGWVAQNPPSSGEAWEPYPVARRVLNWSLTCALVPALGSRLAPWLASQMRFLAAHLERHLLGNHLLCDLCAVVAAAAAVDTPDSESLAMRAARRLERELKRQVLPDGGYAERTAQYHLVVLHDALLALVLHQARGRALDIGAPLRRMLGWAEQVRRSDGTFPWLNDAAPGASPSLDTIHGLAMLAGLVAPVRSPAPAVVELPETGWSIVRQGGHELLFEHGIVGPKHQPGHGHADTLSFELVWEGAPVVVDTGVTTYATGEVRTFERSARAHATIEVNGQGADETWASFRVGGRSHPIYLGCTSPWPGSWLLRARARAFSGWLHRRELVFWPGRILAVCDHVLQAQPGATIVSTVPLAPDWTASMTPSGCRISSSALQLEISVLKGQLVEVIQGRYSDHGGWVGCGFGRARNRVSLSLAPDETGRLVYVIAALEVRASLEGEMLTVVSGDTRGQIALGGAAS
jgi:hypothetical protein